MFIIYLSPRLNSRRISFPELALVCCTVINGDEELQQNKSVTYLIGWVLPCAQCQEDEPPDLPGKHKHWG